MIAVQPTSFPIRQCVAGFVLAAAGLVLGSHAVATDKGKTAYERERAACMDGTSNQDRTTCLREAAAARGEARKGNLTELDSYTQNATRRCQGLPAADREDCVRRVQGAGMTSGSVEGGGVYRETRTTIIGEPASVEPPMQQMPPPVPPAPMYAPMPAPMPAR